MRKYSRRSAVLGVAVAGALSVPLVLSGAASAGADDLAPLYASADPADGRWFVVLEEAMSTASVTPASLGISSEQVNHTYDAVLNGYAVSLTADEARGLRQHDDISYIEEVGIARTTVPWGLDRIDQEDLPLDETYSTEGDGSDTASYVIDTGIDPEHPAFGDRASVAFDALGGDGTDGQGHGTHVAGIVGSEGYGVAPGTELFGVRVLDDEGSGTYDDVIAGIEWVSENAEPNAVANLSLAGPPSQALDGAVNALAASGVFVAVAAGNAGADADTISPGGASGVTTVAASTEEDTAASFSNHGAGVDLYAPGAGIESTVPGGGTERLDGTSMSSPHVAGAAALYKGAFGDHDQDTVQAWFVDNGSEETLSDVPSGTVNLLLNVEGL